MTAFDWKRFLTDYSQELLLRDIYLNWAAVPVSAREAKWLGYPPASNAQIVDAERKLGIHFPDDLRAFYQVTNGWMLCGHTIYDIKPVEKLCWLSQGDPSLWSICEVNPNPPEKADDNAAYEEWYDQGIKVCRSLMVNTRGDDATLLYDADQSIPESEFRFGTWAAWHPAMKWTALTFSDFFKLERETLSQVQDG